MPSKIPKSKKSNKPSRRGSKSCLWRTLLVPRHRKGEYFAGFLSDSYDISLQNLIRWKIGENFCSNKNVSILGNFVLCYVPNGLSLSLSHICFLSHFLSFSLLTSSFNSLDPCHTHTPLSLTHTLKNIYTFTHRIFLR